MATTARSASPLNPLPVLNIRLESGLALLRAALEFAQAVKQDVWQFAVEIDQLHAQGLTNTDLRVLLWEGYALHAVEQVRAEQFSRSFFKLSNLALPAKTCFVITAKGVHRIAGHGDATRHRTRSVNEFRHHETAVVPVEIPVWDIKLRELRWNGQMIKHFRLPAVNQETVLAALQEEGWPPHLDDPLPPVPDIDPKARLHDTIKNLNRRQVNRLLRFHGDGNGQGLTWTLLVRG
jgi:hypothetical protein